MDGPRRRGRNVRLSDASAPEWVPPLPVFPTVAWDFCYATVAFVMTLLTIFFAPTHGGGVLDAPANLPPLAAVVSAAAIALCVFLVCRALPEVSHAKLLAAEARLLETVEGDVRHHWSRFSTRNAMWHVHSLRLVAASGVDGGGGESAHHDEPLPSARPCVVFIHGHSAGAAHWEAVLDRIGKHADVHVLDLPGWGRSPAPAEMAAAPPPQRYTELMGEMLDGWLSCNGLRRVVLVGHSLGGYNAIHFAHRYPRRVSQVILVAPAGLTPLLPEGSLGWGAYFKWLPPQRIARTTGRLGFAVFRTLYLAFTTEDPRFPDVYFQLAACTAATGYGDVAAARFMRLSWDTWWRPGMFWSHPCLSLLMALEMPVSVIWGARDEIVPPIFAPLIHRIRPRTDLYLIHKALHNPAHNNARAFCDAVIDALRKHWHDLDGGRVAPEPAATISLRGESLAVAFCDGTADVLLESGVAPTSTASEVDAAAEVAPPPPSKSPMNINASLHDGCAGAPATVVAAGSVDDGCHDAVSNVRSVNKETVARRAVLLRRLDVGGGSSSNGNASVAGDSPPPSRHSPRSFASSVGDTVSSAGTDGRSLRDEIGAARGDDPTDDGRESRHEWRDDWSRSISTHQLTRRPAQPTDTTSCSATRAAGVAANVTAQTATRTQRHHAPRRPDGDCDGIPRAIGRGRGYCASCFHAVSLHKSYWRCACGAWTFNALAFSTASTRQHFAALLAFLDELYVYGVFNARSSRSIVLVLRPRTPLPPAHPAPVVESMLAQTAALARDGQANRQNGAEANIDAATSQSPLRKAQHAWPLAMDPCSRALLGGLSPAQAVGGTDYGCSDRMGSEGGGISPRAAAGIAGALRHGAAGFVFKRAPAPFSRGRVFLLS